jgi:hypothetical protein
LSPGELHWKAMERVVGYIKVEHYEGLVYAVEKIHCKHADAIRGGTLNCWREDIKTDRDVMSSQDLQHSTTSVTSSARQVQQPPWWQIFTTSSGAEKKV